MRIIQLIQKPQRSGREIFAAQLASHLEEMGHTVLLVSIFKGQATLPFMGMALHLSRPYSQRFIDWQGWQTFSLIVRDFEPDIIQANAADTLKFVVFSQKMYGWKATTIYRNANLMGDFIRGRWHRRFNQWLLNAVEGVISVSKSCEQDLLANFSFDATRCHTIPIGIDAGAIEAASEQPATVMRLPERYVLQIGGLVPEKNHLASLEVLAKLPDQDLHLLFLGQGPLQTLLKAKAKTLGIKHRVHFLGNQANVFPYLKKAKALLMPSWIEGLPGVILEAQYCGVPVIAYAVGGIPEVLAHGQTGWLVPKGDQERFADALAEVLAMHPDSPLTEAAKAQVLESYSLYHIARQFERTYQGYVRQEQPI